MPATTTLISTALVAFGIGLATGWILKLRHKDESDTAFKLQNQLEKALDNHSHYEAEVSEHFNQTAQLLSRMTEDYRTIYNHLASGAEQLCNDATSIPPTTLTAPPDNNTEMPPTTMDAIQPLDYTPYKDSDEQDRLAKATA